MKTMFYPGLHGTTGQAFYGIARRHDATLARTDIVVINSPRLGTATSLWNTHEGRDLVLNKILATDLLGIPTTSLRFFALIDSPDPFGMNGLEYQIQLDFDDYKKKGNPFEGPSRLQRWLHKIGIGKVTFSWWDRHVVGGCANFYTDFEHSRHVPLEEMQELCAAVGYQRQRKGLPDWLTSQFLESSHPT